MCSIFWFKEISGDINLRKEFYASCLDLPQHISDVFRIFQVSKKQLELYMILKSTDQTLHVTFQLNKKCFLEILKLCSKDYSFLCHIEDRNFLGWLNIYDDYWYKLDLRIAKFILSLPKTLRYSYRCQLSRVRHLFATLYKLTV